MSRRLAIVLVAGALGVLVGCGGGGSDAPADQAASSTPDVATTKGSGVPDCPPPEMKVFEGISECEYPPVVFDADADPSDRVAGIAEIARRQGHDDTLAVLADGELTVAERRQAYQDALDCMTSQGMGVAQFEDYDGLYGTKFWFIATWGSLSEADASRVSTECENRHTHLVNQAYEILAGGRFTERTKAVLQECLEGYGVTDEVGDTMDEFREVVPSSEAEYACIGEAEDTPPIPTDLPRPPGGPGE